MKVRPFIYVDGIPTMRDSELWGLFDKMLRDETESEVFYDSRISNHIDFIKFMKSPKNMLYVVLEDDDPIAFGWLNNLKNETAEAHFCLFSEAWKWSVEVGKLLIEKALATSELKMLVGYIPEFNQMALDFARKCGAIKLGTLPYGAVDRTGTLHPMIIVYYER